MTFRSKAVKYTKVCRVCDRELNASEYYNAPGNSDGLKGECKECYNASRRGTDKRGYDPKRHTLERLRKKRAADPEKYKAQTAVSNAV